MTDRRHSSEPTIPARRSTDRPWVGARMSLGSCDDCPQVWVIETTRGKRCARHHAQDKRAARLLHPSAAR